MLVTLSMSVLVGTGLAGSAAKKPKSTGQVVFVGTGGTTQAAMTEAFLKPFAQKYGVKVKQGTQQMSLALAKAAVDSGHPDFDVASVPQADYFAGLKEGLWAPIDYKKYFRRQDLASMPKAVRFSHAVGNITYANNFVFNTDDFPASGPQPRSWVDFWNTKKFPGKRGLPGCQYSAKTSLAEDALLADGVPPDALYPIDIDRALNKIKELAPDAVWYDSSDSALTLTASGEESMAIAPNGRAQIAIDKGAPMQLVWPGARVAFDVWVILKNAPDMVNAQKLVAFMSQPKPQAKMAKLTAYGPTNPAAFKYIDKKTTKKLATNPALAGWTFQKNNRWWAANAQKWIDACTAALGR